MPGCGALPDFYPEQPEVRDAIPEAAEDLHRGCPVGEAGACGIPFGSAGMFCPTAADRPAAETV